MQVQVLLRPLADNGPPPAAGEVHVKPNPACQKAGEPLGLACLVLEHGIDALVKGPGRTEKLVIDVAGLSPCLDDMLAATFAQNLLEGRPLPPGCRAFAHCARALRQGLRPNDQIPVRDSIEGIFHVVRNPQGTWGDDVDLTRPEVGARFLRDWARMADVILAAAGRDLDPTQESPFATAVEFVSERGRLQKDEEVYRDQDVKSHGERWIVRLPVKGKAPLLASGLLLDRPHSLVFFYWCRNDPEAPVGRGYLFLAVRWGEGHWVFSTDPKKRVRIQSLAERLQAADAARDPEGAKQAPWYDGHRPEHNGAWVESPRGRKTALSDQEVLRIVKQWARARQVRRPLPRAMLLALAAVLVAGAAGLLLWLLTRPAPDSPIRVQLSTYAPPRDQRHNLYESLDVEVELAPGEKTLRADVRPYPLANDSQKAHLYDKYHLAEAWITLEELTGPPLKTAGPMTLRVKDARAPCATSEATAGESLFHCEELDFGPNKAWDEKLTVEVPVAPAAETRRVRVRVRERLKGDLYVLSVGIGKYASLPSLKWAPEDARHLYELFQPRPGEGAGSKKVFQEVHPTLLPDGPADTTPVKRDRILKWVQWLKDQHPGPLDLAVVALNGHGLAEDGFFDFLLSDYDPGRLEEGVITAGELYQDLAEAHCNVWLILNTCYSGAFAHTLDREPIKDKEPIRPPARGADLGFVLFASSYPDEESRPGLSWDGSPLVLALREGIRNEFPVASFKGRTPTIPKPAGGLLTLFDLKTYLVKRMPELLEGEKGAFSPKSDFNDDEFLRQVPVAAWQGDRP